MGGQAAFRVQKQQPAVSRRESWEGVGSSRVISKDQDSESDWVGSEQREIDYFPGEVREKGVFDELQGSERTLQQERKSSKNEDDVPWIRCTLFRKYRLSETPKRRHKG